MFESRKIRSDMALTVYELLVRKSKRCFAVWGWREGLIAIQ